MGARRLAGTYRGGVRCGREGLVLGFLWAETIAVSSQPGRCRPSSVETGERGRALPSTNERGELGARARRNV